MNREKLKDYALIAEIVGGLAVLITLAVLVFQIGNNTAAIKAATYDSLVADIGDIVMEGTADEEIFEAEFVANTEGWDALTPRQKARRINYWLAQFFVYERAFLQWESGNLNEANWLRFEKAMCISASDRFEEVVGPVLDNFVTESFTQHRLNTCKNTEN